MCKHMKFFFKQKFVIERKEIVGLCRKIIFLTFCQAREEWIFHGPGKTGGKKCPNNKKTKSRKYIYNFLYFIIFLAHNSPVSWSYLENCDIFLILRIIGLNKHFFFSDLWGRAQCSVPGSRWSTRCHETHISAYQTPLVMTPFVLNGCCPSFQMPGRRHLVCIQSSAALI